jgi:hypothetical protein
MTRVWIVLILVCSGAAYYAGWQHHPVETQTIEKTTDGVITEKIVWKDKIVTVIQEEKHNDGSISTTTTTTEDQSVEKEKEQVVHEKVVEVEKRVASTSDKANSYSLGLMYRPVFPMDLSERWRPDWHRVTVEIGYRVLGNVWVDTGVELGTKSLTLGIRYQW